MVDEAACIGAGQCVLYAPAVFDLRDGVALVLQAAPVPGATAACRSASTGRTATMSSMRCSPR